MSAINQVSRDDYDIRGFNKSHDELAWYATSDNLAIGVVVTDRETGTFSWMVLTQTEFAPAYSGVDVATDVITEEHEAMAQLYSAMFRAAIEAPR